MENEKNFLKYVDQDLKKIDSKILELEINGKSWDYQTYDIQHRIVRKKILVLRQEVTERVNNL